MILKALLRIAGWYGVFTLSYLICREIGILDFPAMAFLGCFLGMRIQSEIHKYDKQKLEKMMHENPHSIYITVEDKT